MLQISSFGREGNQGLITIKTAMIPVWEQDLPDFILWYHLRIWTMSN